MKCVVHPDREADYIFNGCSACAECFQMATGGVQVVCPKPDPWRDSFAEPNISTSKEK